MKIYFAGSIRSGRSKVADYSKIVGKLQEFGTVLTTHVADTTLTSSGEQDLNESQIYARDLKWLQEADLLVADVSIASLGVGYEIALSEKLNKKIICLYDECAENKLSAMIAGNPNLMIFKYKNIDEALKFLEKNI